MLTTHDLPEVMRVEDIARYLDVSRDTAYQLVAREGFPLLRIGRLFRVPREAFLRWLERTTASSC